MPYQFAAGYNNAAGLADLDLANKGITWQPRMTGLSVGRRLQTGDGHIVERGMKSCILQFGFLNEAQYTAFLTQTGLDSAVSVECTLRMPNNADRSFTNYNAILVRPDIPNDGAWWGTEANSRLKLVEVGFPVTHIEEIA